MFGRVGPSSTSGADRSQAKSGRPKCPKAAVSKNPGEVSASRSMIARGDVTPVSHPAITRVLG